MTDLLQAKLFAFRYVHGDVKTKNMNLDYHRNIKKIHIFEWLELKLRIQRT